MTDLILTGADIRSAPFHQSRGRALRVRDGRILSVDGTVASRSERGAVELPGGCLLPGFVDAHLHFRALVRRRHSLDCLMARTGAELLALLAESAAAGSAWIFAHGLEHRRPGFGTLPGLAELDRVTAGRPLWLRHRSGHLSLLNSAALRLLGWWERDPPDGRVEREQSRPSGAIYGAEALLGDWMRAHHPAPAEPDLAATAQELLRLGVTAFADLTPANRAEELPVWSRLHESGTVPQRVSLWVRADSLMHRSRDAAVRSVSLGGIKVLLEPDAGNDPTPAELATIFGQAQRGGWPVAVHAVESDAIATVLEALRLARAAPPHVSPAVRIEHGHLLPAALIAALGREAVALCVQPGMLWRQGEVYSHSIPAGQWPWILPIRGLDGAAGALAIGSDAPAAPLNLLRHVAAAVTRRDAQGRAWNPAEQIGVERALAAITRDAARLAGFGAAAGELLPGMSADAVYFNEAWDEFGAALEQGEPPVPAGTLIAGHWQAWDTASVPAPGSHRKEPG